MKRRLLLSAVVVLVIFLFALVANQASAKDLTVTLAAGDTARIPIKFWCLDFGKPFPTSITGPISSPPDAALLVLQAALARGTTESDPYQTQLAIWRAADGTFHDVGGAGHVLAEQIYNDSLKLKVPAVPANTLAAAVTQGTVTVTFENYLPISDTTHSALPPYSGTADLVVKNTSNQSVTFVALDGAIYKPVSGTNEQSLISHQDTAKQAVLPTVVPTVAATTMPTVAATVAATVAPTVAPTMAATVAPTVAPTVAATVAATVAPTVAPTTAAPNTLPNTGGNAAQNLPGGPLLLLELGGLLVVLGIAVAVSMSARRETRSARH